jgi:hypothetical protein
MKHPQNIGTKSVFFPTKKARFFGFSLDGPLLKMYVTYSKMCVI